MIKKIINKVKNSPVIKNSFWIIAEKIVQMVIALFINRAVAQYLQPSNYGVLNYGASIVTFFTGICTLGLNAIVVNEIINKPKQQGEILGTSIFMRMLSSCFSVIAIGILISILKPGDSTIATITILQAIALLFDSFNTIQLWYQSKLKSKYTSLIAFLVYIIVAIFKVALVLLKKETIWFAFSNTLTSLLTMLLTYYLYKKQNGPKLQLKKDLIKPLISQSYHFILSGLMASVYAQTDKIMIGSMIADMSAVGYYSVSTTITNLWSFIPSALITSLRPSIIEAKIVSKDLYTKKLKQLYSLILWINIAYALFVTIFANFIINVLYGPEYINAKVPLLLAVWSGGFSYVGVARDIWLVAEKYQKYSKWFSLIGSITNVILNFLLIPTLGIVGAAIATTVTQITTGVIVTLFFKETRINTKYILESFIFKF